MTSDQRTATASRAEPGCALCGRTPSRRLFAKGGYDFVRCEACGLVSLRPLPTAAALAAHHEASYREGGYAAFAAAESVREAIARRRLSAIRSLAPEGCWLDVGCSTGTFVAEAARAGMRAEGLELSEAAVVEARARGLVVHRGSAETYEPPGRLAVVTAFDVLEHLPEPAGFLRRVRGWLVPGGLLALTLPNVASLPARLMGRHWFYYAAPDHVHYFAPTTIRRLLADSGFRDVRVCSTWKPLTLDYAAAQLARMTPPLSPLARAAARLTPARLRALPIPLPLGEMLLTARPETPAR